MTTQSADDVHAPKSWTVRIDIGEHDGTTRATAHLQAPGRAPLTGTGTARLNPADRDVPLIGDELAASRAMSQLAHALLDAAAEDISTVLHSDVQLTG